MAYRQGLSDGQLEGQNEGENEKSLRKVDLFAHAGLRDWLPPPPPHLNCEAGYGPVLYNWGLYTVLLRVRAVLFCFFIILGVSRN